MQDGNVQTIHKNIDNPSITNNYKSNIFIYNSHTVEIWSDLQM